MDIVKINDSNIDLLESFIKNDLPQSFRYFKTRNLECIKYHLLTLVGTIDNNSIAYGHIDFDTESNKYWLGICVLEKYQNNGYGKKILNELLKYYDESKIEQLYLTVDKTNTIAKKMYEKNGFVIIEEKENYYLMYKNKNILMLPVSYGEAIDKLTILDIKLEKIGDSRRLEVKIEFDKLNNILKPYINKCKYYYDLLKSINLSIWDKQDIFRYSSDKKNKDKLCYEIIEENDMRFRIKNKINVILNSQLKEQKGYKPKKGFVLTHLGLGDHITAIPAVRYLSLLYDEVTVVCKVHNEKNVKSFYEDDPTIKLFIIKEDWDISPRYKNNYALVTSGYDTYLSGCHKNSKISDIPFSFYNDMGLDYSVFWKYFYLPTTNNNEKLYDILKDNQIDNYLFIHNSASTGIVFDIDYLINKKIIDDKNKYLLVNPCINMYKEGDKYYDIAQKFIGHKLVDYCKLIKEASKVIMSDSSFFCMAVQLEIKTNECYVIGRNQIYNYIWEDKFGYNKNMKQKKFFSI